MHTKEKARKSKAKEEGEEAGKAKGEESGGVNYDSLFYDISSCILTYDS